MRRYRAQRIASRQSLPRRPEPALGDGPVRAGVHSGVLKPLHGGPRMCTDAASEGSGISPISFTVFGGTGGLSSASRASPRMKPRSFELSKVLRTWLRTDWLCPEQRSFRRFMSVEHVVASQITTKHQLGCHSRSQTFEFDLRVYWTNVVNAPVFELVGFFTVVDDEQTKNLDAMVSGHRKRPETARPLVRP